MQTRREMAEEIIAVMRTWDMPRIHGASFDEATGNVVFKMDRRDHYFEVRFDPPDGIDGDRAGACKGECMPEPTWAPQEC